jgi:hypothetical protein
VNDRVEIIEDDVEWTLSNVARAFAMLALALVSSGKVTVEDAVQLRGFSHSPMPEGQAVRLREAALIGQVTTVVAGPEPYTFIYMAGGYGSVRTVRGIWMERKASFYGKVLPPLKPSLMVSGEDIELPEFIAEGTS